MRYNIYRREEDKTIMNKKFNSIEEIKKYYDKKTNTYIFKEGKDYIDIVTFDFNLKIRANIDAINIKAKNIDAWGIIAESIKAENITAADINIDDIKALDIFSEDIDANDIKANDITAGNIDACNITAHDITALDINAYKLKAEDIDAGNIIASDIVAKDIYYFAVCVAYKNLKCRSIKGKRKNAKYLILDETVGVENDK